MKLRRSFRPSSFLFALTVAACGGASTSDVLTNPEATAFGTQPEGHEPTTTSTSLPSSPANEEPAKPGPPDAGPSNPPPPETKDPTPVATTIRCGDSACNAGSEVCCASITNSGKAKFACQAASSGSCGYALKIACDDRSDCSPNEVCCASREDSSFVSVSCRTKCEGQAARLCDPKAAVDECAAIGKTCGSSESFPGYGACN